MKNIFYFWFACFISLLVLIGIVVSLQLKGSTSLILTVLLGGGLVASILLFVIFSKKGLSSSISTLRKTSESESNEALDARNDESDSENMKIVGSYNAFHHTGEVFKTIMQGDPAVLDFNCDSIRIKVLPDGQQTQEIYIYNKDTTEILWVGNSGRFKDYTTWLEIRGIEGASLVSAFMGNHIESTEYYTESLYFKLSACGYNIGIDTRKRGFLRQCLLLTILFIFGIYMLIIKEWVLGPISIITSCIFLYLEMRPRKGPKRSHG